MKELINRRGRDYHQKRLEGLTESDKIASVLLAFSYSRRASPTPKSQSLIQMDCVAVCEVDNDIWVASNSKAITNEDLAQLAKVYPDTAIYIVANGSKSMHAEMQLLLQLIMEEKTTSYMGVSKPCCWKCAKKLSEKNIRYADCHKDKVVNWEPPEKEYYIE